MMDKTKGCQEETFGEKTYDCRRPETPKEKELVQRCYKEGMKNSWASGRVEFADGGFLVEEDRLNPNSICIMKDLQQLKKFFKDDNWTLGQGVIFGDLFFLQQIDGGDEWATFKITDKDIRQFESVTFKPMIERGEFEKYIKEDIRKYMKEQLG